MSNIAERFRAHSRCLRSIFMTDTETLHDAYRDMFKATRRSHVLILTVGRLREVHIGISKGAPGDHVSAYSNGEHRAGGAELLVQHSLRDVGVQVADVQRSHRITPRRRVHISDLTKVNVKLASKKMLRGRETGYRIPGPNEKKNKKRQTWKTTIEGKSSSIFRCRLWVEARSCNLFFFL